MNTVLSMLLVSTLIAQLDSSIPYRIAPKTWDGRYSSGKAERSETYRLEQIRKQNILPKFRVSGSQNLSDCRAKTAQNSMDVRKYVYLKRPNSNNIVAVLLVKRDGSVILNPEDNFIYGFIPRLDKLNRYEANALWSNENNKDKSSKNSYTLMVQGNREKVNLDIKFEKDSLKAYRVRGKSIQKSIWVDVD